MNFSTIISWINPTERKEKDRKDKDDKDRKDKEDASNGNIKFNQFQDINIYISSSH